MDPARASTSSSYLAAEQLKERLLACVDAEFNIINISGALDALTMLERRLLTKDELEATRLGKHVNDLRKQSQFDHPDISRRCKALIKSWQKLVEPPPGATAPSSGSVTPRTPFAQQQARLVTPTNAHTNSPHLQRFIPHAVSSPSLSRHYLPNGLDGQTQNSPSSVDSSAPLTIRIPRAVITRESSPSAAAAAAAASRKRKATSPASSTASGEKRSRNGHIDEAKLQRRASEYLSEKAATKLKTTAELMAEMSSALPQGFELTTPELGADSDADEDRRSSSGKKKKKKRRKKKDKEKKEKVDRKRTSSTKKGRKPKEAPPPTPPPVVLVVIAPPKPAEQAPVPVVEEEEEEPVDVYQIIPTHESGVIVPKITAPAWSLPPEEKEEVDEPKPVPSRIKKSPSPPPKAPTPSPEVPPPSRAASESPPAAAPVPPPDWYRNLPPVRTPPEQLEAEFSSLLSLGNSSPTLVDREIPGVTGVLEPRLGRFSAWNERFEAGTTTARTSSVGLLNDASNENTENQPENLPKIAMNFAFNCPPYVDVGLPDFDEFRYPDADRYLAYEWWNAPKT